MLAFKEKGSADGKIPITGKLRQNKRPRTSMEAKHSMANFWPLVGCE